jgi:hypothetical protein
VGQMLIYHPAFDAYHCVFRLLYATNILNELEVAKLRILDFYLAFPSEVMSIKLPRDQVYIRKSAQLLQNVYHGPVNAKQAFRDMEHIQNAVIRSLGASNLLDQSALNEGMVLRTNKGLPTEFISAFESFSIKENLVVKFILEKLVNLPLNGMDGLKDRTGLMEYRYDNV